MKRITINQGKVGLLFQRGDYRKVLAEGAYWVGPFTEVKLYDKSVPFYAPVDLSLLLADAQLAAQLTVVEVGDSQIALEFRNGNFARVLTAGRYAYWKGLVDFTFIKCDLSKAEITEKVPLAVLHSKEVSPYIRQFTVEAYEQGLLFIDGRFEQILPTGTHYFWRNAMLVQVMKADMRLRQVDVTGQDVLTKDKAAIRVNLQAQYKVYDAQKALVGSRNAADQLYGLLQLALRQYTGTFTLDELLDSKEAVADYVLKNVKAKAAELGLTLVGCGVRDLILPGDVKDIMNQVLVAQKKAQANIITRREETASTRSLLNTAKLMEDNDMLFKLKEMEYVEKIADKINSITLSGGSQVVDQLKHLFAPRS